MTNKELYEQIKTLYEQVGVELKANNGVETDKSKNLIKHLRILYKELRTRFADYEKENNLIYQGKDHITTYGAYFCKSESQAISDLKNQIRGLGGVSILLCDNKVAVRYKDYNCFYTIKAVRQEKGWLSYMHYLYQKRRNLNEEALEWAKGEQNED